jgi:hypothetical protein
MFSIILSDEKLGNKQSQVGRAAHEAIMNAL